MKILVWVFLLMIISSASADQLALIHTPSTTCVPGGLRSLCKISKLDLPKSGDLVAICLTPTDCWANPPPKVASFSSVPGSTFIDGCNNPDIKAGSAPSWEACGNFWKPIIANTFVPVSPGSVRIQVFPATTGDAATSFWVYSAVKGAALGKLKQIMLPATSIDLPGYTTVGTYTFGATAVNAQGESPMSSTIEYEVKAPPTLPKKPGAPSLSIKSVTIE